MMSIALAALLVLSENPQARVEGVLLQADGVKPRYAAEKTDKMRVYAELQMGVKIEGSDVLAGLVRSMHPFLSMEKMLVRAEGTAQLTAKNRHKVEVDEARVELRYDDEDHELDYVKGDPAPDEKEKLRQMMWYLAAGGRNYTLTPEGEFRSDDPNQDHTGEAMDLIGMAIIRMPDKAVREGDAYEKSWKGARSEKGKKGVFAYTQKVKVAKIEEKDGNKLVTLEAELNGKLEGAPKDPNAEEARTTCQGKSRVVLDLGTGRVMSSGGSGKVVAYHRGTAENGAKQELTLTFSVEGKLSAK